MEQARIPEGDRYPDPGDLCGVVSGQRQETDIAYDTVTDRMVVCDVVLIRSARCFYRRQRDGGARIVTGMGMLVHQGCSNFELWTGKEGAVGDYVSSTGERIWAFKLACRDIMVRRDLE